MLPEDHSLDVAFVMLYLAFGLMVTLMIETYSAWHEDLDTPAPTHISWWETEALV